MSGTIGFIRLVFLFNIICITGIFAQEIIFPKDSLEAIRYLEIGEENLHNEIYDSGDSIYFFYGKEFFNVDSSWKPYVRSLVGLGEHRVYNQNQDGGKILFDKVVMICKKKRDTINMDMAVAYQNLASISSYSEAQDYYLKSKEISQKYLDIEEGVLTFIESCLGLSLISAKSLGEFDKAIGYNIEADSICKQLGELCNNKGKILQDRAIVEHFRGDKKMFKTYTLKSIEVLKKEGASPRTIGNSYFNLSYALDQEERYEKAMEHIFQALEHYRENPKKNHDMITMSLGALASLYDDIGELDKAIKCYEEAIVTTDKILVNIKSADKTKFQTDQAANYYNFGRFYAMNNNAKEAEKYTSKALELYKEVHNYRGHPDLFKTYSNLGYIVLMRDNTLLIDAFEYEHKAIFSNAVSGKAPLELFKLPSKNTFTYPVSAIEQIDLKSSYALKIFNKNNDIKFLKHAYDCAVLTDSLIEDVIISKKSEGDKIGISCEGQCTYDLGIRATYKLYSNTGDDFYLREAFRLCQRSKSLVLLKQMKAQEQIQKTNDPALIKLLKQDEQLRNERAKQQSILQRQITTGISEDSITNLHDKLIEIDKQQTQLRLKIKQHSPDFFNVYHDLSTAQLPKIQQTLNDGEAIIEYFVGSENIFAFVITKEKVTIHDLTSPFDLKTSVLKFREVLGESSSMSTEFDTLAHDLYLELIAPIRDNLDGIKQLKIMPHGELSYLPFGALMSKILEASGDYLNYPFLLKEFNIGYDYSSTHLMKRRIIDNERVKFLGVGPQFGDTLLYAFGTTRSAPLALRYNMEEVSNINEITEGDILIGDEATADSFLEQVGEYNVIHFASHAFVDLENYLESYIVFYSPDSTGYERLHIYDLLDKNFKTKLLVLSICDGGYGKYEASEGMMSIARHLSKNTQSIVSSLWKVDDETSSKIMVKFYEHLHSGEDKSKALNLAQLDYLNSFKNASGANPKFAHPYYWANFMVFGNTEAIYPRKRGMQIPLYILIPTILLLSLLFYLFIRRRR